ncbi:MAG: NAD(+)/NADH kinase [Pseudomonadota bacterium]
MTLLRIDHQNQRAVSLARYLERHLDLAALPPDLCLVLGGDGTMLRAIRDLGSGWTFLGLNFGRVGFLMNDVEVPSTVRSLLAEGRYQVHDLPRLALTAWMGPGEASRGDAERTVTALALNDVFAERMTAQSCHLRVTIDDHVVVDPLVCDGLIVATALGSTAYSLSAGGPACHAMLQSLHITPICAFAPRLLPIALPLTSRVEIEPLDADHRPVRAVADGIGYPQVRRMRVENSGVDVRLAFLEGHDFTATLFRKVLLG